MKHTLGLVRSLPLALAALCSGCGGTETGNPTLPATELRVAAISNDFQSVAIGLPGPGLTLEVASAGLGVSLLGCNGGASLDFAAVDASLVLKPPLTLRAQGSAANYCGARVGLAPSNSGQLKGHSVYVSGRTANGTAFELALPDAVELDLVTQPPNTPFAGGRLILGFNFATWLDGVDVSGATAENGVIVIDETHNPEVLAAFLERAPLAPALYDDADGNGQLAGDDQPAVAGPEQN